MAEGASNSTLGNYEKNVPVIIMLSVFVPVGIIGNVLILYVYGKRFKESTTRMFILSLAVFDLITCVCLPYKVLLLRFGDVFSNLHLARLEMVRIYFLQVSVMILPLVSIDRYRRICKPQKKQISPSLARRLVVGLCILMATMTALRMIISSDSTGKYRAEALISTKYLNQGPQTSLWTYFYFAYMGLPFFVPLPIMITMYSLIGMEIRKLSRRMILRKRPIYPSSVDTSSHVTVNETGEGRSGGSMNYCSQIISQKETRKAIPGEDIMTSGKEDCDNVVGGSEDSRKDVSGRLSTTKAKTSSSSRRYVNKEVLRDLTRQSESSKSKQRKHAESQETWYPTSDMNYNGTFQRREDAQVEELPVGPKRAFSVKYRSTKSRKAKAQENIASSSPNLLTEDIGNARLPDRQASVDDSFETNDIRASASLHEITDRSSAILTHTDDISNHNDSELEKSSDSETPQGYVGTEDLGVSPEVRGDDPEVGGGPTSTSSVPRLPWKKMTFIFFMITVVYIIACLPFLVLFVIFRVSEEYGRILLSYRIGIVLYNFPYITNISNCFLYGFFDPRFRRELKTLRQTVTCSAMGVQETM